MFLSPGGKYAHARLQDLSTSWEMTGKKQHYVNNLSHVTALNYLYAVVLVCSGFLGGLVSAGVLGWDHISTGPIIVQGNKDGTVHGAKAPCTADQTPKLWHSRSQTFLRAEHHKITSLCFFAKPENTWKTKDFPELGVEISKRWSAVLMKAGLNALKSSN